MRNGPYILRLAPGDYPGKKYRGRYVYEHHLVWWQYTGTLVPTGMVLHHIDHDRHNNAIGNLSLLPMAEHSIRHNRKPRPEAACAGCGKAFTPSLRQRSRAARRGTPTRMFCTPECYTRFVSKCVNSWRRGAVATSEQRSRR